MFLLYSLICLLPVCLAFQYYQDRIPNGNNVLHPCIPNYRWPGVGHENRNGGGARNVFGQAFASAGFQWSTTLCQQDSDGDGRTNGEELGDPSCSWSSGQVPYRTTNITNPGVCEPLNDPKCAGKNSFVSCQLESFDNCSVINNSDVQTIDLRFPEISIPPTETNYMCMSFDLPMDQDYHIVADQAIINNSNVLHHMLLYGCEDANSTFISEPQPCGMSGSVCTSILSGWTVGQSGQCYGESVGFRIGATGYRRVRLEVHYNNPTMNANFKDSSGLRLYIRPARSDVQDIFTLMTGQMILQLPPGQSRVEQVGVCKSDCTLMQFNQPVYVISALNHMHYLGRSMKIELYRNGVLISNLTNDEFYSYDSPMTHMHNPHVQILPGDEIITKCVYNTLSSNRWVYYGEGTSDEMCYGFLAIYPKSALNRPDTSCVAQTSLSYCDLKHGTPVDGCNWLGIYYAYDPVIIRLSMELQKNCNLDGFCRPECKSVVNSVLSHPCFQGEVSKFVKQFMAMSKEGLEFLGRLHSCPVTPVQNCTQQCPELCHQTTTVAGYQTTAVAGYQTTTVAGYQTTTFTDVGAFAAAVNIFHTSAVMPLVIIITAFQLMIKF